MSSIFNRMSVDDYFRMGYIYQQQGDLHSAVDCYLRSIEEHGPSAEAHTFLAWTLSLLGEMEGAIEEARKATKLDPEFGNAWNELGVYFTKKRQYTKAIRFLKRACKSKNYDTPSLPHYNIALIHMRKGLLKEAQRELETSLEINPDFDSAKKLLERIQLLLN